jgi:superfamily I DNA/RNA helicase
MACVVTKEHMCAEDVVAVTFTKRAAASLREKLAELDVPIITVATLDSFLMSLIADVRRRAPKPSLTWLCLTRKDREAKLQEAITAGKDEEVRPLLWISPIR